MQSSHPISTEPEHLSVADRIESFKAGFLGAIASVFAFFAISLLHHFLQNFLRSILANFVVLSFKYFDFFFTICLFMFQERK